MRTALSALTPSFLQMFTYRSLYGSQGKSASRSLFSRDYPPRTARKYFGNKDPIGETITTQVSWGEKQNWTITSVLEDPPSNSILQFDILLSSPVDRDNLWEMQLTINLFKRCHPIPMSWLGKSLIIYPTYLTSKIRKVRFQYY